MGFFNRTSKSKDKEIKYLRSEVKHLKDLSDKKDAWMNAVASESMRKGGSLVAKVLSDKKKYLKNK